MRRRCAAFDECVISDNVRVVGVVVEYTESVLDGLEVRGECDEFGEY